MIATKRVKLHFQIEFVMIAKLSENEKGEWKWKGLFCFL